MKLFKTIAAATAAMCTFSGSAHAGQGFNITFDTSGSSFPTAIEPAPVLWGKPMTNPIDTNETDEGRANNRRVEFVVAEE